MNEQQVIALINAQIKANDNKEITGNILNLVLKEMVAQPNLLIGDLSSLSTGVNDDLVGAINWLLTQISGGNIVIHTGQNNPNETPPATYTVGDLYSQLDVMNNPLYLWQYTGTEWARISNSIDDSIEALDTTWSSYKISEAIKGDRLNSNGTIVLDGNEITISDLSWWIQGNPYVLIPPFSDTIPYTSELGYSRKDIVVAIQANSLIRIPGEEGTGVVQPPQVPPNTLLVTEFDVYHDSIGETSMPVFGGQYIEKITEQWFYSQNAANVIDTLPVIINGNRRKIRFQANIGVGTFHIGRLDYGTVGATSIASIWGGMDVTFQNVGLNDITIKHFDTSLPVLPNTYRILCPQNQDVILKTGESITLSYDNYSGYFNTVSLAKLSEGSTSDDISNESTVTGANVTEALEDLQGQIENIDVFTGLTGDVTAGSDGVTTIANGVVTNAKLANMGANTVKGRVSSTGAPMDIPMGANTVLTNTGTFLQGFTVPQSRLFGRGSTGNLGAIQLGNNIIFNEGIIDVTAVASTTPNDSSVDGSMISDALNNLDTDKLDKAPDGTNNLIDVDNKLNPIYLPSNIMHLQGQWNADTNTPTLSNGTGVAGYIYEVTTAGTTDFGDGDIEFALGDWVVYGGDGKWYKSPNTGEVVGVKGDNEVAYRKGLVNLTTSNVVTDGSISTAMIGDNQVTFDKIQTIPAKTILVNNQTTEGVPQTTTTIGANNVVVRNGASGGANIGGFSVTANSLFGRTTGNFANITLGTNLSFDGDVLNATGGGITELTGDVTASGTGSVTATIPNGTVTNAKMANMSGYSVKVKPTTGSGAPTDIALSTNTVLGRGTGNIVPLTLGNGLQISGSVLNTNDRYTKTHYVDLTMSMAQFLNSHNVKIPFPELGLTGGEHAIIESYVGEIKFDVSGGSLLPNNADTMRPQIFNSTGSQELAFSSYGNPQISPITGNVHLVNQFFMNNWLNIPTTGFMYGNYVAVNVSGSPTGSVRVRVYYKISNFN